MRPHRFLGLALLCSSACGSSTNDPIDAGLDAQASACAPATGAGTIHGGSVTAAETWTAAASPHRIPYDTSISATLTIEPCATVLIAAQRTITVSAGGRIVADGTAAAPIVIDKDTGNWATIRALGGGTLRLSYTTLAGGGDPLNGGADLTGALDIRADQAAPLAEILHVDHVRIEGSLGQGVYLHESGAFSSTSTDLVITGSKGYPIHASANLAGTIPTGTYTGNGVDELLLSGADTAQTISSSDVTFHDRGVPYHVGTSQGAGRLDVGGKPGATGKLTIEPGVTLRFKKGGALYVDYSHGASAATGTLVAVGTSTKRIVFTSAEPTPKAGDWLGLNFGDLPSSGDRLDFVDVRYAGGSSSSGSSSCPYVGMPINDAAIRIYGVPTSAFVTNTRITDSAAHGIDRGWASDTKPDFLMDGTNTFMALPGCTQTFPKDSNNGGCTSPPPCPK